MFLLCVGVVDVFVDVVDVVVVGVVGYGVVDVFVDGVVVVIVFGVVVGCWC